MNQGDKYYIIDAGEKQWLIQHGFEALASKFDVEVNYNGDSYLGCKADSINFFDYDFDSIDPEFCYFETVYYYKSGMFFDQP